MLLEWRKNYLVLGVEHTSRASVLLNGRHEPVRSTVGKVINHGASNGGRTARDCRPATRGHGSVYSWLGPMSLCVSDGWRLERVLGAPFGMQHRRARRMPGC